MHPTPSGDPGATVALTGTSAIETRDQAAALRAQAKRTELDLRRREEAARADLDRRIAELRADFDRQRAELEAQMAPIRDQLKQMSEVLWTVDLYLGRDETLRLLRDGEPAPADTPITLRQRVLVMAEESLVHMGRRTTGMNAEDVPEFITWLLEDDTHLDRVLPEPKGVVVLVPTRVESRTGNAFEDAARDAANRRAHWLIRNGERVYMLTTDPELKVHDRVLPKRTEFTEVFERRLFGYSGPALGEPVEPGSEEWLEMERHASALQRHYMRVLLVLQGLIDRTPAWHPLPDGGVSFLRLADQDEGRIRLIQDGDDSLQLTDGRPDFRTWQLQLNKQLRPGMRVIGDWHTRDFHDEYVTGDRWRRGYHPRIHPGNAEYPPANVPHLIEDRRDGGLVIRYARTEEVWKRNVPVPDKPGYVYREAFVPASQRASCVVKSSDKWVLPFDLATVEDLTYYLNSRDNRSGHFLTMVPVIRAALDAKEQEAAQETPFRGLLERALISEGADPAVAPGLVEDLVHWWKVKNTWARPLNGEPEHEARAHREIITEYQARRAHHTDPVRDTAITVGSQVPGALAVTRNRKGQWHVYTPSPGHDHDPGVFVDITPIRKNGTLGAPKTEQTPAQRAISALHVAWAADDWATWTFGANRRHYLTRSERQQAIDQMLQLADGLVLCVTERHDASRAPGERTMAVYWWAGQEPPEDREPTATRDPYSGHFSRMDGALIASAERRIVKDNDGVHLYTGRRSEHPRSFGQYTASTPWGPVPWWPDSERQYSYETRPRLVWADEPALGRIAAYRRRCEALVDEQWEARKAREAEAYRYSQPVADAIEARLVTEARARFDEDYGPDADDLWDAHLASLNLQCPIHPRDLWSLMDAALAAGRPIVGQTLGQLADAAFSEGRQRVDLKGQESIIVGEPEPEEGDGR